MKLKVRLFALYREIIGKETIEVNIVPRCTIKIFIHLLIEKYPQLRKYQNDIIIALNHRCAKSSDKIKQGDIVVLFPPVNGG